LFEIFYGLSVIAVLESLNARIERLADRGQDPESAPTIQDS
jgi:hypothetical protein